MEIQIQFSEACNPAQDTFQAVFIDLAAQLPYIGQFGIFTPAVSGLDFVLNEAETQLSIGTTGNMLDWSTDGEPFLLGTVCFRNAPNDSVISSITLSGPNGEFCETTQEVPLDCPPASDTWMHMYGDTLPNYPSRIRYFESSVYMVGYFTDADSLPYATLSRFDANSGILLWQKKLDFPSLFNDLTFDPATNRILVVGQTVFSTTQGSTIDNASILYVFESNGDLHTNNSFNLGGQEQFQRIIYHPNAANPQAPFYLTGIGSQQEPVVSDFNHTFLLNLTTQYEVHWVQRYTEQANNEVQVHQGIVPLLNGNLLLLGGRIFGSRGVLVPVEGASGQVILAEASQQLDSLTLYDGVQLPSGNVAILAGRTTVEETVVLIFHPETMSFLTGMRIPSLRYAREIGLEGSSTTNISRLYTLARASLTDSGQVHVMHRFSFQETGFLFPNYSQYLEADEIAFDAPHFCVVPEQNYIFYADARLPNPTLFGAMDVLIGRFPLDFQSACTHPLEVTPLTYIPQTELLLYKGFLQNLVAQPLSPSGTLGYQLESYCTPQLECSAHIQYTTECLQATLFGSAMGVPPFEYFWDINCDDSVQMDTFGQTVTWDFQEPGFFNACLVIQDSMGCVATASSTVLISEFDLLEINCPDPIHVLVSACEGGAYVDLDAYISSDLCAWTLASCSHESGDFFPCGVTEVSCQVSDQLGNTAECTYTVTVECTCVEVLETEIQCTDYDNQFAFTLTLGDLPGGIEGTCSFGWSTNQPGVELDSVLVDSNPGGGYQVSGLITVSSASLPLWLNLDIQATCTCPLGNQVVCLIPVSLPTPCCQEIWLEPFEICREEDFLSIYLEPCDQLDQVLQVRWFLAEAPCPSMEDFGPPFQVSDGCAPLSLIPAYHSSEICVYAEVWMGQGAGPCSLLVSPITTIQLCEPLRCHLPAQEFCYSGTPVQPEVLELSLSPFPFNCSYSIQWFDQNGPIPGADSTIFLPPALDFTEDNSVCFQDYTYTAVITSPCGEKECAGVVRLFNEFAPNGILDIQSNELPLCPGDDAVLTYTPICAGQPEQYNWFQSEDGIHYNYLEGNGLLNPVLFTNKLYQDTWIKVEKQNGNCPSVAAEVLLEVRTPLEILDFSSTTTPFCDPTTALLSVSFSADTTCDYTVSWFRNGNLLFTTLQETSPVSLELSASIPALLSGNYHVEIESNCCDEQVRSEVITLPRPMRVFAAGPCFRCEDELILLEGFLINGVGNSCSFQWYNNGDLIPGATNPFLVVPPTMGGLFTFEVTCIDNDSICIKSDDYELFQCGDPNPPDEFIEVLIYPNPANDWVSLELSGDHQIAHIQLFTIQGELLRSYQNLGSDSVLRINLQDLPDGTYVLHGFNAKGMYFSKLIVKM